MKKLALAIFAVAIAFSSVAEAKHKPGHKGAKHRVKPVEKPEAEYREVSVGDPTIIYHQIGTAGAQKDNTIVPFYGEPIRSVRPYEIRYDYSDFR